MSSGLRVGLVGCGLIGRKRAGALTASGDQLIAVYDENAPVAEQLAADFDATAVDSFKKLLSHQLDVVVVATVHSALAEYSCLALEAGSNVLVEKPAGISCAQIQQIKRAAAQAKRLVKVGFNHRFYPGIKEAVEQALSGSYGKVMFVRARYGHGGRIGYEDEWRMDPRISGGGELIDQGMHILDLSHWLLGSLPLQSSLLRTNFWSTEVEDNALLNLADPNDQHGPWCVMHTTWTEWKNMFSLEIYCKTAKFQIDGLSGSYGNQRLITYLMKPAMGPPDVQEQTFEGDPTWGSEWANFKAAIKANDPKLMLGDLDSAEYAWKIVEAAYEKQREQVKA